MEEQTNQALAPYEAQEVVIEILPFEDRSKIILSGSTWRAMASYFDITGQETYDRAVQYLLDISAAKAQVLESRRKSKFLAAETHRQICKEEQEDLAPLTEAEEQLKRKVEAWENAQDEIQHKIMRERRLAMKQTTVGNMPAIIPPAAPTFKKSENLTRTRARHRAQVFDIRALCQAIAEGRVSPMYIQGAQEKLDDLAAAEGSKMSIPGVRAVPDDRPNIRIRRKP